MSFFSYTRSQWNSFRPEKENAPVRDRIWKQIRRALFVNKLRRRAIPLVGLISSLAACLAVGYFVGRGSGSSQVVPEPVTQWVIAESSAGVLPDGSKVWLESGSRLRFDETFPGQRKVSLEGNASFDVVSTHDSAPFVVHLAEADVVVTGTSFSVKQNVPGEIFVSLYEGAVTFVTPSRQVFLRPREQLFYSHDGSMDVRPFFAGIDWQGGCYRLLDTPFKDVIAFLNWKYDIEISSDLRDSLMQRPLTGMIGHDEPSASVIDKVCYVMGLEYRREGRSYRLYPAR